MKLVLMCFIILPVTSSDSLFDQHKQFLSASWERLSNLLSSRKENKKNVLMIIVDDLRPEIGPYKDFAPSPVHPKMHTPNMDKLASKSTVFQRAYVQYALCGPSRSSFLTSRRPDTLKQYMFDSFRVTANKDIITLPQYFKNNGYTSIGIGKVFDPPRQHGIDEADYSYSKPWYDAPNFHFWAKKEKAHSWIAVTPEEERRKPLPDNQIADRAVEELRKFSGGASKPPFFMSVGFHKPHCPYVFPEKYLAYYPESSVEMPVNPQMPTNYPSEAWTNYHNLRRFHDLASFSGAYNTTLPENVTLSLRRAYYASVSYIDDMVGQVLDELDHLELTDDTIVVLLSDHGYHLGENAEWTKQTTLELSTRSPLIIKIPGVTDNHVDREELVEFVDIFPTIVEASGFDPLPLCPEKDSIKTPACREGLSLVPLLGNTDPHPWKERIFSMQRWLSSGSFGHTMRTHRYRYTEWSHIHRPNNNDLLATELYDHQTDPLENHNVAYDPEMRDIIHYLSEQLKRNWRGALPAEEEQ